MVTFNELLNYTLVLLGVISIIIEINNRKK